MVNIVKYFGGAIKFNAIDMNSDQAFELKMIYEESPYTQNDPLILEELNKFLEEKQ